MRRHQTKEDSMINARIGKALLVASAVAGLALIAQHSPGKAASRTYCAAYAQEVARDYAGHRGLIGSALALPFDVTGAVLTGRTTYDARYEHAYSRAYADCRASGRVAIVTSGTRTHAFAVAPEAAIVPEEEDSGCNFHKYGSWDPTRC
jgi:hypothetical protein